MADRNSNAAITAMIEHGLTRADAIERKGVEI